MSGYIKYFDNSGKNMSFKIEYNNALVKYNEIWRKIKNFVANLFMLKNT